MSESSPPTERDNPKLRQILESAVDLPAERRGAFLDEACAGDGKLRAEVESLLLALVQAQGFLAAPTVGDDTAAAHDGAGNSIGRYKLLQKIGEGGMGVVFMAEQERPVVRRVAIKIIKMGMDTRQVIARFEAERQALALMDHPNIARVLDAGATDTGRPYFVMELVRGVSITEYCDSNNLSTRQRLELFLPVCRAVQHAHQKGIIHRDIKPSNVLITMHDGVPVPKVIDFGIAKATSGRLTDKTLFTQYHQFVGTPEYMSPEQAEMSGLDIDTRADVYALGVLLYELLTGTTPFDAKTLRDAAYAEIQRIIREVEPPKPSTRLSTLGQTLTSVAAHRGIDPRKLSALMRGDLDWIVMKCLEKDRTRRYETANAVAKDVQRYLNDEPVEASPPSATYKLRKIARKHKKQMAVAVAIIALLVLGIFGTSIGMIQARFAVGRAQKAEALATERKTAAEKALVEATRNAARADTVNAFMKKMLASPVRAGGFLRPGDVRMINVLEEAANLLDTELNDQPEAQAQVRDTLGMTYYGLGMPIWAEKQLRFAYGSMLKAQGEEAEQTLAIALHLAFVLGRQDLQPDVMRSEGEILARKTYEIAARKFGADHDLTIQAAATLSSCLARREDAAKLLQDYVRKAREKGEDNETARRLYQVYAKVLLDLGQLDQAEQIQRELVRLYNEKPGVSWAVNGAEVFLVYAQVLQAQKKSDEARQFYEKAVAFQRARLSPSHPIVIDTTSQYSGFLEQIGDYRGALARQEELMEIWRSQGDTKSVSYRQGQLNTSRLLLHIGEIDQAVRTENQAFEDAQVLIGFITPEWVDNWVKLLLAAQFGPDRDWKSPALQTNVWCALFDHLLQKPGGGGLCVDGVDWDRLQFQLERWKGAENFEVVAAGKFQDLRGIANPTPGIYRLSMDVPRFVSKEIQHVQHWLFFSTWELDLYGPTSEQDNPRAYQALLSRWAAEHRECSSLALGNQLGQRIVANTGSYALAGSSSVNLPAGRYRFSATSADGLRLFVDERLVIDSWVLRGVPSGDSVVLDLVSGAHALRVEIFQRLYISRRIGNHLVWDSGDEQQIRSDAQGWHLWLQIAPTTQPSTSTVPVLGGNKLAERSRHVELADLERRLTAQIEQRPEKWKLLVRGEFYARSGRFNKAADDYAAALRFDSHANVPTRHHCWEWLQSATLALQAGRLEDYRGQCREMLSRFGSITDRQVCEQVVKACIVIPDAVPDLRPVMELADRAVVPGDRDVPMEVQWRAQAKGMAEYRAGHFDAAAEWLAKGTTEYSDTAGGAVTNLFLAMAQFRRGRIAEAQAAMKIGSEILEREGPKDGKFDRRYVEWIVALHAQKEAVALLGHSVPQPPANHR